MPASFERKASMESSIRVFLVAPSLIRWGLVKLLSTAAPHIQLLGSAPSLDDAADEIDTQFPDVVVVDTTHCSTAAIRSVYERARVKILALSAAGRSDRSNDYPQDWIDTRTTPAGFVRAIESAAGRRPPPFEESDRGVSDVPPRPAQSHPTIQNLTPKQARIIDTLARYPSAPAKVLADHLHMSEHTLRNRLTEIYAKFGVSGRTHLQSVIHVHRLGNSRPALDAHLR